MAAGLIPTPIRPVVVRASASDGSGGRKAPPARAGGSNWWSPLFGWPAEPDYIDGPRSEAAAKKAPAPSAKNEEEEEEEEKQRRPGSRRFAAFTEEKARELRMRTKETETFHDVMYHSAIASRLATDLPRRSPAADL